MQHYKGRITHKNRKRKTSNESHSKENVGGKLSPYLKLRASRLGGRVREYPWVRGIAGRGLGGGGEGVATSTRDEGGN